MSDLVLDASVILKWFRAAGERHVRAARVLRSQFEAGELTAFAPSLLKLEIVNVAGRRWGWDEPSLLELAKSLDDLGLEVVQSETSRVARWTARGLTAYDAAYVAVAEAEAITLVTDDELVCATAPGVTRPLRDWESAG